MEPVRIRARSQAAKSRKVAKSIESTKYHQDSEVSEDVML